MNRTYKIKEIYYTIQGEGAQTGRPAVFVRFTGCNLWSGREADRATAICQFCDTDFFGTDGVNGGRYSADELISVIRQCWNGKAEHPFIVLTGGEPMLQLDQALVDALHDAGIEIAVETNGTIAAPQHLDWICVSPKAGGDLVQRSGNELKLVYPQNGMDPLEYEALDFDVFSLQPLDDSDLEEHTHAVINFCKEHPKWKLSLQTHKLLGLP